MEVTFLEQRWEIPNSSPDVDQLFETMNTLLDDQRLHISHMTVDGQHIYDNYKMYVQERINLIRQIEVNVVTMKQYVNQLVVSSHQYCAQALEQLPELITQFYQQPSQDSWRQFEQLLEGLDWLTQFIQLIQDTNMEYSNIVVYAGIGQAIQVVLPELFESVKLEQHTAIGDVLQHELLPQLETLYQELQKTMDGEGISYDPK